MRYGVLMSGRRFVCMFAMDTKPSSRTMMTATRMVNGFLTLNFSMISYPFLFYAAARQKVRRNHGSTL